MPADHTVSYPNTHLMPGTKVLPVDHTAEILAELRCLREDVQRLREDVQRLRTEVKMLKPIGFDAPLIGSSEANSIAQTILAMDRVTARVRA